MGVSVSIEKYNGTWLALGAIFLYYLTHELKPALKTLARCLPNLAGTGIAQPANLQNLGTANPYRWLVHCGDWRDYPQRPILARIPA